MAYAPAPPLRPARGSPSFPACGTGVLRTRHGRRGIVSASPNALPATPLPTHRRKRNCRMEKRELVIIGAGPAGLSAAIYGKRAGLDTLVLEKGRPGGQVLITSKIETIPAYWMALAPGWRTPSAPMPSISRPNSAPLPCRNWKFATARRSSRSRRFRNRRRKRSSWPAGPASASRAAPAKARTRAWAFPTAPYATRRSSRSWK